MKKVLGIGNALVDILSQIESDVFLGEVSLAKGSMQLIDEKQMCFIKDKICHLNQHLTTGGSASNTISGLSKLGINSGFLGKIGADGIGSFFKKDAQEQGINIHLLNSNNQSGCCVALISPDGERTMATFLGAASDLKIEDLSLDIFKDYSILHIEGYLVYNQPLIEKAVVLAKEAGLKVSIDLASFNVVDDNLHFLQELVKNHVDIVFANESEAASFTGKDAKEAVMHIAEMCDIAIVKIGEQGSLIKSKSSDRVYVPANTKKAIDTTGAGDLYAAGFLYGYTHGYSLDICGKIGSIVAGHVVEVIGAKMNEQKWTKIKDEISSIITENL